MHVNSVHFVTLMTETKLFVEQASVDKNQFNLSRQLLDEFFIAKTRVLDLSVGEDFVILPYLVFTHCQRVTDR